MGRGPMGWLSINPRYTPHHAAAHTMHDRRACDGWTVRERAGGVGRQTGKQKRENAHRT